MGREKNDVLLGLLYGEKASQKCILPGVCFRKKAIVKKKKEPATARTRPKGLIYVSNIQLFGENSLTIKLDNLVLIVLVCIQKIFFFINLHKKHVVVKTFFCRSISA